jgi:hypothetical protein
MMRSAAMVQDSQTETISFQTLLAMNLLFSGTWTLYASSNEGWAAKIILTEMVDATEARHSS